MPTAKLLSTVVDTLITHPNVVNGASLYWTLPNVQYVEGYALDEFANDRIGLLPFTNGANKVGLLLDQAIEADLRLRHIQVAEVARATLGIDVSECVVTSAPVGVCVKDVSEGGAAWGSVDDVDTLLRGARALRDRGCSAIAVVARFPEDDEGGMDARH